MPGFIIHLTEAQMIINRLEERGFFQDYSSDEKTKWIQLFQLGILLPDTPHSQEMKNSSHYRNPDDKGKLVVAPDISFFLSKYRPEWNNPILAGCYAHLLLDYTFFIQFLPEHVIFRDENGNSTAYIRDAVKAYIKKSNKIVSIKEFFSESYLYGNYTALNLKLIKQFKLKTPVYLEYTNPVLESKWTDLPALLQKMDKFLISSTEHPENTEVFSLDSLINFLKINVILFEEKIGEEN